MLRCRPACLEGLWKAWLQQHSGKQPRLLSAGPLPQPEPPVLSPSCTEMYFCTLKAPFCAARNLPSTQPLQALHPKPSAFLISAISSLKSKFSSWKQKLLALIVSEPPFEHSCICKVISWPGTSLPFLHISLSAGRSQKHLSACKLRAERRAPSFPTPVPLKITSLLTCLR